MFQSLPGFRDFYPEDCSIRNHIFKIWRQSARLFGFQEYDAPVLEPLELLTTKSGEEIVTQLFNFVDRGGRAITLRPEMTPSLARLVGAKANSMPKPIKWFNISENFRYERPQKGRLRSFYQFNCDIFGEPSPTADAECIALLIYSLTAFGLNSQDFCIRLSDRNLWVYFLHKWGIEGEENTHKVLSIIDKIEREKPEKTLELLTPFFHEQALSFFEQAQELAKLNSLEALQNFFRKQCTSLNIEKRLEEWKLLIENLTALNLMPFIKIDLSIVRGLAYYTGFVFEAFQLIGQARSLSGGGRYDNLVKKLGGPDLPAVGWAIGDVTLRDFLELKNLLPKYFDSPEYYVISENHHCQLIALHDVNRMRTEGYRVEYPLKDMALGKQIKQASDIGAKFALIYGENEIESNSLIIKDLTLRQEIKIPRDHLINVLESIRHEGKLPSSI